VSAAKRTTITISEALYAKAEELMRLRDFGDFSGFIQQLIREEYERRHGPATLAEKKKSPARLKPEERS
jgi:metal-responsive CopG/Arc/MetJ family transcriptional regulator